MDKARKPDRPGPKPPGREVQVNRRALAVVALAGLLAVPAPLGLKAIRERSGRSALLLDAKRQRDEVRGPELTLGHLNRHETGRPDRAEFARASGAVK